MPEFRGNGMAIARDLLTAVGGWPVGALTEDLDLTSRVAAAGVRVAVDPALRVGEQPAGGLTALGRQRLRWAEGAIRRVLELGPTTLAGPLPARARLDFVAYVGQLAAPPVLLGALVGLATAGAGGAAVGLAIEYAAAGSALCWAGLRFESIVEEGSRDSALERLGRVVRGGLFSSIWLIAVPGALVRIAVRRGPLRFEKMAHRAAAAP